ncbi:class I SAM-dependent methyltransferase [Novispirillum itersonii]|uniref:SAM-dependent methyltransferase n=1 Tax=Novispirillum itersonii TaxID=189 RepID=A0A7W9ZED8_NOVIT|nr:class I SAM-dependent methyltransferase [Novispirillum itersonii]MBB6209875.1 SAM-dependent methyltransferase [Novispirillum itersonii]
MDPVRVPPPDLPLEVDLIAHSYGAAVRARGATSLGVGWSTTDVQMLRLSVLCDLLDQADPAVPVHVHDLGCGWGALWGLLQDRTAPPVAQYTGYDITPEMIHTARRTYPAAGQRVRFVLSAHAEEPADYGFVSGTYNFSDGAAPSVWEPYVEESLRHFLFQCRKGMAFNLLHQRRRTDRPMYYTDPQRWQDWLEAEAAPRGGRVWCRDDYLEDDFTLFVRFPD